LGPSLTGFKRVEAENISFAQAKYLLKPADAPNQWFHPKELRKIHSAGKGVVSQRLNPTQLDALVKAMDRMMAKEAAENS